MKILANENFPGEAVDALHANGFDVVWNRTLSPEIKDEEVLSFAVKENRILITFDKDFGELAFKRKITAPCGIILFRIVPSTASKISKIAVSSLKSRSDWAGHFSVIEENRIRMTKLPTP